METAVLAHPAFDAPSGVDAPLDAPLGSPLDAPLGSPLDAPPAAALTRTIDDIAGVATGLVDRTTTVLCLASVMSTQLGDAGERAGVVAARAEDIAGRSREAAGATAEIRTLVAGARQAVGALAACARDIERISATLSRLALETRFVGLNAAIEAARAGAAGAGFTVVADKVRELADGARDASAQIVEQLSSIRDAALSSVDVMAQVDARIGSVDAHAIGIAAAAGEQESSLAEMASGIAQISASVDEVVRVVEDMTEAGMRLSGDADEARGAIAALQGDAPAAGARQDAS